MARNTKTQRKPVVVVEISDTAAELETIEVFEMPLASVAKAYRKQLVKLGYEVRLQAHMAGHRTIVAKGNGTVKVVWMRRSIPLRGTTARRFIVDSIKTARGDI